MDESSAIMDSDSEEDEHSANSQRINEIIAKARDVQRLQKPLLRDFINIEDDIRKNYRRSVVRRAMQSNAVTSTPYASARQPHLNISSILELPTGGEDENKRNTEQNANLSSGAKEAIKDGSTEEINNPVKETEVLIESGLQLIEDNFRKPLTPYRTLATTSALKGIKKTKPFSSEKQMNDSKSVESSVLRRNSEHSNGSGVALEYKCRPQSKPGTSKQDIMQTKTQGNNSINGDIEYRKEIVPYLSDTRQTRLRTGEYGRKSKVEDDSIQDTCRQKDQFHREMRKKITRESKKYMKQSNLHNPDSESHNKDKNKMRHKSKFYDYTADSDDSDQTLVRHKDNKSYRFSVKEKNMRGRASKYHNQSDISGYSSSTEEILVKKKKVDHGYIPYTYRKKEKRRTEAIVENNRKIAKLHKKDNHSVERFIQHDDNLNDVSSGSISSAVYTTKSKNFQKVPVRIYKKRSIKGGASKYHYQSDISISPATEKCRKRFHKKGDKKNVALKHDKYTSKRERETNIIHESDMERKQIAKNRKTNVFQKTKSFPKKRHDSSLSISMSSISTECDQSCVSKYSDEGNSSTYKSIYLHNQENQRKSHRLLKYRGKSIPQKIQSRSAKSSYCHHKHNSSDFEEKENDVPTSKNNHGKYFRLPKMTKNELKIKRYISSGKEYEKFEKPNEDIGNNILSNVQNGDINSLSSLPKTSLEALVNNLLIKALQKKQTSSRDAPTETARKQDSPPELNFLCNALFPNTGSYIEDDTFNFGHSQTPSIVSDKKQSPPQKISVKNFARNPFTKLDNDTIPKSIEFSRSDFNFFKKTTCVGNKIVRERNKCGLFQRFKCLENEDVNCVPLTRPSQKRNYRKSVLPSERIAIKAKLDEVLGFNKDDCNEEKIIQEQQKILDSVPHFSIQSQTTLKNSKVHNSTIEKQNRSLKINSAKNLSEMKKCKLSVGTQYSPFINDATEKYCLPVTSYNVSIDTHKTIQNNVDVERDVGHSRNITSSNKKNDMPTNTSLNTNKNNKSKFIKSRTVLTFDEDMESNRDMDLISDTHKTIQNNVDVERDVGHSRNITSSNKKNDMPTNTSLNTNKNNKSKFIKSRTVLTFDEDMESNRDMDLISDTHKTIQNNVDVERDVGHSRNITSSNKKNDMPTNTSLNTNKNNKSKFIKSRTVLTFDEDMESNRDMDLISDTHKTIQNNVDVERDVGHSRNITSSNKKNDMPTNTSLNTNKKNKSMFIKSRTVLTFDEDMESNRDMDLISDTHKTIQNNVDVERDVGHSRNITSSNKKNDMPTNTSLNTNKNNKSKFINSRTVLTFDEDMESNRDMDLISPIVELTENGASESPFKSFGSQTLKNDFLIDSDELKNNRKYSSSIDQTKIEFNKTLKQGENISSTPNSSPTQLLVCLERINTEEKSLSILRKKHEEQENNYSQNGLSSVAELKENGELEASFINNGNYTAKDRTKIKVLHNITLKKGSNSGLSVKEGKDLSKSLINSKSRQGEQKKSNIGLANNSRREPFVYIERMNLVKMKKLLSKSSNKSKKTRERGKEANVGLASDIQVLANFEEPEGVRKSTRNRRPPQFVWWKSSVVEKGADMIEHYEACQKEKTRKGNNQRENDEASSVVRNKGTSFKKGHGTKKNKKKDIPTKEAKSKSSKSKRIIVSNKTETSIEKPSTSKATGEELTCPGDYSIKNIPLGDSKKDNLSCSNTIPILENSDDPGYVTSSTRKEKENYFTKLCKNMQAADAQPDVRVFMNIGEALSLEKNFGYLIMKPEQTKKTVNLKYDMIYFIIDGTCVFRTNYENSIKGPKDILSIKRETPYQIRNSESQPLLMMFACFL